MNKWVTASLVALPVVAAGGLFYGQAVADSQTAEQKQQVSEDAYICPLTGERLPCPECCQLNK
jgi:hypothetical protein